MGKKKKPFIDKKKAHTFHLVHRSQKDPLQADDESSKHVLVPLNSGQQDSSANDSLTIKHRRKEEEKKCGIFFDDDYDYLQHIKPRTNPTLEPLPENVSFLETKEHIQFGNVQLPTEVFASRYEEPEGLLNLAAPTYGPRPDLDPDIVAALDDALDLDDPKNILEDDFVLKANEEDGDYESEDDLIRSDDEHNHFFPSDEASDSEADDEFSHFEEEETKSRFTNYSLTSSVLRRNEGLKLIDERFEKLMEEYDEDEIGALDHEELEGTMNPDSERLHALAEEFIERQQNQNSAEINESESSVMHNTDGVVDEDNKDDSSDSLDEFIRIKEEPKEKWDCESILSTYSNLYNHPTLIKDPPKVKPIKLSKDGIPLGVFSHGGVSRTLKGGEGGAVEDAKTEQTCMAHNSIRSKDETKEEKKLRKQDVKSDRKVRRMEKKANKIAFKSEKQKQEFSLMHTKQQQGKKL